MVPVKNGSNPEAPDGGHSTQEGTVDDAAGDVTDDDAVPLVDAADVEVDDDPPAAVGAANVTGAAVAAEGVVAAIAGRPTAPAAVGVPAGGVAPIVERFTAPEPVVVVCAAAGPTSAIRSGSVNRNGWAIPVSNPCLMQRYEASRVDIPARCLQALASSRSTQLQLQQKSVGPRLIPSRRWLRQPVFSPVTSITSARIEHPLR